MGLNYTLNHCLKYADTEFIARMDGDDISLPTRFETEIKFLEEHLEIAVVSVPMYYFDENGDYRKAFGKDAEIPKYDVIPGTPVCHAPCMARTAAFKAVGDYSVDKKLLRLEDYHLWFKMFKEGYKFYELEKPYYKMRDDRNAVVRRNWQGRKNEAYVRHIGYNMIGLPWWCQIYVLRPIILGLMPNFIYNFLHRKR